MYSFLPKQLVSPQYIYTCIYITHPKVSVYAIFPALFLYSMCGKRKPLSHVAHRSFSLVRSVFEGFKGRGALSFPTRASYLLTSRDRHIVVIVTAEAASSQHVYSPTTRYMR